MNNWNSNIEYFTEEISKDLLQDYRKKFCLGFDIKCTVVFKYINNSDYFRAFYGSIDQAEKDIIDIKNKKNDIESIQLTRYIII